MKLTMLGTGHATVTKCYNTCFALTEGNRHFLVDAGGGNGILERLKAAEIPVTDIHDIFVTFNRAVCYFISGSVRSKL